MLEALFSHAFWILFSIGALIALVALCGTVWQSFHLTGARPMIDDGTDRPESVEAYGLDRSSTRLSVASSFALALLVVLAIAGSAVGQFGHAVIIAALVALVLVADAIRSRHARLEKRFDALWQAHEEKTGGCADVGQKLAA